MIAMDHGIKVAFVLGWGFFAAIVIFLVLVGRDVWRAQKRERTLRQTWQRLFARGMTSKKYEEWRADR